MTQQTKTSTVKIQTPQLMLPDAKSTVEAVIHRAIEFCAEKLRIDDFGKVEQLLHQHDAVACRFCRYSIAKQIGHSLGALDENVNSVYILDFDATPQDVCFADTEGWTLIHLIVRVERKTNALNSLAEALDRALLEDYAKLFALEKLEHLLDIQVVDETDVEQRIGYGAMISSLYQKPIQLWERR